MELPTNRLVYLGAFGGINVRPQGASTTASVGPGLSLLFTGASAETIIGVLNRGATASPV